jgi:phospholipid/cholesterol/gamma-HCH transport system substrate-binding protein
MRPRLTALLLLLTVLTACSYDGASSLPLPGAVGGPDTYTITVTFTDAANLVPKETCRTNDTVVGSVVSVELDHHLDARVVCRIKNSARIPGNVVATLRETSLLGERFVGLDVPPGARPQGRLAPNASIPASKTVVNPNTEVVLGALSQVLNGGSLGSIATISRELITALDGRTGTARQAAERLATTLKSFDDHRQGLVDTLDQLDRISSTLARQRGVIAGTLDELPQGLAVLDRQRPRLTAALQRLDRLSGTVVPLIRRSRANTVADLQHLRPVLSQLAKSGDELSLSLERLASFPFNANTLYTIKGDYSGAYVQANMDLDSVNRLLGDLLDQNGGGTPSGPGTPGLPSVPNVPGLPGLPGLGGLSGLGLSDMASRSSTGSSSGATQVRGQLSDRQPRTLADLLVGP